MKKLYTIKMSESRGNWLRKWLDPANLIALVGLIIAALGLWGGITIFTNRQGVKATDNCKITDSEQNQTGKRSSSQNINCGDGSVIDGVIQNQSN